MPDENSQKVSGHPAQADQTALKLEDFLPYRLNVCASLVSQALSRIYRDRHKIGVPECDEFIANYDACVSSKVPEVARAQYKTAIEQWRTSWKKLAENPQTKSTLAAACKQSAEQARASMKTYNCTF